MADIPDELEVLQVFVEAHAQPHPNTGGREPILYLRYIGGSSLQHHGLEEPPTGVDEALLEDMHTKGFITIDYLEHSWKITPTHFGRTVVQEGDRAASRELIADIDPLVDALSLQLRTENPLAWPAVRPVLLALRDYWQAGGFPQDGVQLLAIYEALPDEHGPLFVTTIRALQDGGYLAEAGVLGGVATDHLGRRSHLAAEVTITEKARTVIDGWPGAAPEELVENLLAVLSAAAADEPDPGRKRRLETLAEAIKEVGVSVTSEVIAKVITGGMP